MDSIPVNPRRAGHGHQIHIALIDEVTYQQGSYINSENRTHVLVGYKLIPYQMHQFSFTYYKLFTLLNNE